MTRDEAIERIRDDLDKNKKYLSSEYKKALNMAIEALSIIRCKDCKHWSEWENGTGSCHRSANDWNWVGVDATDYCSFAERREP